MIARPAWLALLVSVLLLSVSGCDRLFDKGAKQSIEAAGKKAAAGNFAEALNLYESALDGTAGSADVHYRMALIYADKLKSPSDALHHFNRYLELAPKGAHAKEAQDYQKEGERLLLANLSQGSPLTQDEAVKLKNENLTLRNLLTTVRAQKIAASATPPPGAKKGEIQQKPIPPGTRTHTVKPGDTFASIALKYYKNKARYRDIQDANFYPTQTTPKIKPGMLLAVP